MGAFVTRKYPVLLAAIFVALLCAFFLQAEQSLSADTTWMTKRFTYPDLQPRNVAAPTAGYIFRGVEINGSCLIRPENFRSLFQYLVGQAVTDADIVKMMSRMRQFLKTQGFRDVQTTYEASQVDDGIAPIAVSATLPKSKMAQAREQCAPEQINGHVKTTKTTGSDQKVLVPVKETRLEGMEEVDPAPFRKQLDNMVGRQFNASEVVRLMQEIRKAYRNTSQPLPRVAFDSERAKQGIIALTVEEEQYFTPLQREEKDPADVPVKVARTLRETTKSAQAPSKTLTTTSSTTSGTPPKRFTFQGLELLDTPAMRKAAQMANTAVATATPPKKKAPPQEAVQKEPQSNQKPDTKPEAQPKQPVKAPDDVPAGIAAQEEQTPTLADENIVLADAPQINFEDIETPEDITYKERPEEQLLILQTYVDDIPREEAILGFRTEKDKQTLLSLSGVADTLGVPIEVRPDQGAATGWVRNPDKKFGLVYPFKAWRLGEKMGQLRPGDAELHFDDIYVTARTMEKMFNVDMTLNSSTLELFINPNEPFPFQQKRQRRKRWERIKNSQSQRYRPEAPKRDAPYAMLAKPTIRVNHGTSYSHTEDENTTNHNTNISTRGDLAGFSSQSTLSLRKDDSEPLEIDEFELLLTRRDATNSMLGPLNASSIELGDVNLQSVPLIDTNRSGRGVEVTNEPLNFVRDPDNLALEGFLPPGWDVEIFQDERLLDFQTVGNSGRYEFEAIPLRSGTNVFRIVGYGPNGERREEERRFFLGPGMVKEGEFIYQLSALEGTEPLFNTIGNNAERPDLGSVLQGSFSYGVNRKLSLTGAVVDGNINELDTQAVTGGVRASLLETFMQLDAMAEKEGGRIYRATGRRNVTDTLQLLASGETSSGFAPEVRTDKSEWFVRLDKSIQLGTLQPIGFSFGYREETFNNGQNDLTTLENRVNAFVKGFNLSNEIDIEKRAGTDDRLTGEFTARRRLFGNGFWRGRLNYTRDQERGLEFRNASLRGQFNFGKNVTYVGELNKDLTGEKALRLSNRLSWEWGGFRWGASNQIRDNGDYQIGLNIGTTLTPQQNGYSISSDSAASSKGTVLARVFIDENEDKTYQHGEPLVEGVQVVNNRRNAAYKTNENGVASLEKMAPFAPNRMSIDESSLPDFYLQPADEVVSVIARPGIVGTVDMPVYQLGEIAGTVVLKQNGESKILDGAPIVLRDEDGTNIGDLESEYDGFFVFPSLRMGTYTLTIPQAYLAQYGITEPIKTVVDLAADQSIVDDVTLEVAAEAQTN